MKLADLIFAIAFGFLILLSDWAVVGGPNF